MRKAAAVKLTVPALSAAHMLGDCLAAARTMRCHRLTLVRRSRAQPGAALRPVTADAMPPLCAPQLLDQVRKRVRYLHDSRRTEQAYVHWCKAFIRFHGLRHPRDLGAAEVEAFLLTSLTRH